MAIGTIYKYFKDKSDVCTHVFQRGSGREVEMVEQCAFPPDIPKSEWGNCKERLEQTIIVFSKRALAGHRLAYALIAEPIDPQVEAERLKYRASYADIFARLVEEGVTNGEFRPQDSRVAATAIVGALSETLVGPLAAVSRGQQDLQQKDIISSISDFCLNAVEIHN